MHEQKCEKCTFASLSLPQFGFWNLTGDLSLNSQANSINNPDTSEYKTPKSAARVWAQGPALVWLYMHLAVD